MQSVDLEGVTVNIYDDQLTITIDGEDSFDIAVPDVGDMLDVEGANFHSYVIDTWVAPSSVSSSIVYENLREDPFPIISANPIPWLKTNTPVYNGEIREVPLGGNVIHYVDPGDQTVVNVTLENQHIFDPGLAIRIVHEVDGEQYIMTIGLGNGDWSLLNETIGPSLFEMNARGISHESKLEGGALILNGYTLHQNRILAAGDDATAKDSDTYTDDIQEKFNDGESNSSPLVLDLDGDGIELVSLASSDAVYWSHLLNGFAQASGWVGSDDGLLAVDVNQDGIINDSSELFGNTNGYGNGFLALAAYDSNNDNLITAEDTSWGDLIVWIDGNGDGFSQPNELYSLDTLFITEIDLGYSDVNYALAGNEILQESSFTINGTNNDIVDAYFSYSHLNTVYNSDFTVNLEAVSLPSLRGYGTLPDLHIAMSLDNTGTGNLLDLVDTLADKSFADIFTDDSTIMDDVTAIMYRWAGVDGVDPTSRGPNIDARQLEFLEAMMGQDFLQGGWIEDPGQWAGEDLKEAFHIAQQNIFARLVVQSSGGDLFTGDWYYDIATDAVVGVTGLDSTVLSILETEATSATNPDIFWQNVVRMIDNTVGISNLSGSDQTALDTAITNSDASLDLTDIADSLAYAAPDGDTYNGTSGDDTLTGGVGNDTLIGGYGNDTLEGGIGDDYIQGGPGDDIYKGQTGQDYMVDGGGNDVYHYEPGHGWDIIRESQTGVGHEDTILFGAGIDITDLSFTRQGNNDLIIDIDNGTSTGQIWIENQFNYAAGGGHVEWLEFSDSSTFDLDGQDWTTYGTANADTIYGVGSGGGGSDTIYGGDGNDIIYGNAPNQTDYETNYLYGEGGNDTIKGSGGDDFIYGGDGDDTLYGFGGNDLLDGGSGENTMHGGHGDDTYIYSGGHQTIEEGSTGSGTDEIQLDAVWNSVTPVYYKIGSDLQIVFDTNNTITIKGYNSVESMVYADTTTVDLTSISYITQGDENDNTLWGTSSDDTLYGFGGNDTIRGQNGNDSLYGGTGDDKLYGYYGDDYLAGGAGNDILYGDSDNDHYYYVSGHDWLQDLSGTADLLEIAEGWDLGDLSLIRYGTRLKNLKTPATPHVRHQRHS